MILIVDDKQENLFSLKTLLEINKFEVDTAISGEDALRKVLRNSYSLLLLDVQMPGMDGFEVASAISGYSKLKDLPIIFISAVNVDKKFITKGYHSGAVDYLTKPIDPDILLLKVKTFYRLSRQNIELKFVHKDLSDEVEQRKNAEFELNNRNNELLSLIEAIPQIAFTADSTGRLETVNSHWYEYSSNKFLFPETYPGEPEIETYWQHAIRQEIRFETEVRLKSVSTGEFHYHLLIIAPAKKDQKTFKWIGTLTDINEQKAANDLLERRVNERTRELKEINRLIEISNKDMEQFASLASHDLKEPLRKIKTYSSFIKSKNVNEAQETDYIDLIINSSQRMTQLIDSLLNYSTISGSELFKVCNPNTLIAEVIQDLKHVIHEKQARISVANMPEMEIIPAQISQVFQNLLANALKFSQKNLPPVIDISCELLDEKSCTAPVSETGKYCRIKVQDNGIGFDNEYCDKIFMSFQRLNSKSEYEGNGLGLAMVKRIINKHSGIISGSGKDMKGATFTIVLPICKDSLLNN